MDSRDDKGYEERKMVRSKQTRKKGEDEDDQQTRTKMIGELEDGKQAITRRDTQAVEVVFVVCVAHFGS